MKSSVGLFALLLALVLLAIWAYAAALSAAEGSWGVPATGALHAVRRDLSAGRGSFLIATASGGAPRTARARLAWPRVLRAEPRLGWGWLGLDGRRIWWSSGERWIKQGVVSS